MGRLRFAIAAVLTACFLGVPQAFAVQSFFLDFEGLTDLEDVTTQFAAQYATFAGATALTSGAVGGSLNEIDFPPQSGVNVLHDLAGPITIDFGLTAYDWSAYLTYNA